VADAATTSPLARVQVARGRAVAAAVAAERAVAALAVAAAAGEEHRDGDREEGAHGRA
jgi:hypothetical protein